MGRTVNVTGWNKYDVQIHSLISLYDRIFRFQHGIGPFETSPDRQRFFGLWRVCAVLRRMQGFAGPQGPVELMKSVRQNNQIPPKRQISLALWRNLSVQLWSAIQHSRVWSFVELNLECLWRPRLWDARHARHVRTADGQNSQGALAVSPHKQGF